MGDDENDEDAFALDGNTIPVRVGQKRQSHARYYLRSQAEIDRLLETLVLFRASGARSADLALEIRAASDGSQDSP